MIALGSILTPDQPQPKPSRSRITFLTSFRARLKLSQILMQLKCPDGTQSPMRYKPSPSCWHEGIIARNSSLPPRLLSPPLLTTKTPGKSSDDFSLTASRFNLIMDCFLQDP